MPADAGIYGQFAQPVRSIADYTNALNSQALQAQQMQTGQINLLQARQGMADQAVTRNALMSLQPGATDEDRIKALQGTGTPTGYAAADALAKAAQARAESQAKVGLDTSHAAEFKASAAGKVLETARGLLPQVQNPQMAAQWVDALYSHPATADLVKGLGTPEQAKAAIPQDPAQFKQWLQMNAMGMDKFIANQTTQRGQDMTASTAKEGQKVTMRGQDMTAGTAAAGQRVTMRGQDMTDARSRESTAATMTKPFEITGQDGKPVLVQQDKQGNIVPVQGFGPKSGSSKPMTDSQAKSLLFGTRMQESNKVLAELDGMASTPGIMSNGVIGSVVSAVSGPEQQKLAQAKRDFLNATLRRESGAVIGDTEFANADKQYFPQIGDSKQVIAQKSKNRAVAISGVLAEVPEGQRASITPAAQPKTGGFSDTEKERRYQEWKAKQK